MPDGATGGRQCAPAAARNRDPIWQVLRTHLPASGLILEMASGTGEHVIHFARLAPHLQWQPSDPAAAARASIAAWMRAETLPNIRPPLDLDATTTPWPLAGLEGIVCINMLHISPWIATQGLMEGAGSCLAAGGFLFLYGPFLQAGVPTAASNLAFDADLKRRDARWGLRNLEDVIALANAYGLAHVGTVTMPANNLSVIFRRSAAA